MSHFLTITLENRHTLILEPGKGILTELDGSNHPFAQTALDRQETVLMRCLIEWFPDYCQYPLLLATLYGGEQTYWQHQVSAALEAKTATRLLGQISETKYRLQKKIQEFSYMIVLYKYIGYGLMEKQEISHAA